MSAIALAGFRVEQCVEWTIETHRPEVDYRKLRPEDQHEYWKWRHEHADRH